MDSESNASVIGPMQPNPSQQTRKTLYTKHRMPVNRQNELKMTDKMKLKDNKFKNKIPFTRSGNQIDSIHNKRNESKGRTDSSRERSISRSDKQQVKRGQYISHIDCALLNVQ